MRAWVLDTSVIVAGLLSRRGAAARLVDGIFSGVIQPAYTSPLIAEYGEVLARPELKILPSERWAVLLKVRSSGLPVVPRLAAIKLPDEDDRPFIEAALGTVDRVVVTLNERDFAPARSLGVRVLRPAEALRLL